MPYLLLNPCRWIFVKPHLYLRLFYNYLKSSFVRSRLVVLFRHGGLLDNCPRLTCILLYSPVTRSPRNISPVPFSTSVNILSRKHCGFLMTAPAFSPVNSDRNFDKVRTPLSRRFPSERLTCHYAWLLLMSGSFDRIFLRVDLTAFQEGFRIRRTGPIISGEYRPNPPLTFLRFSPPNTNILLSIVRLVGKSSADGATAVSWLSSPLHFRPCGPFDLFGRLFLFATVAILVRSVYALAPHHPVSGAISELVKRTCDIWPDIFLFGRF